MKFIVVASDSLLCNNESCDDLIEHEIHYRLTIGFKGRNFLFPLHKLLNNDNDIIIPPAETGLQVIKSTVHLVKIPTAMMG